MDKNLFNEDLNNQRSINYNSSKKENYVGECPICNKLRKTFYCKVCVSNGDFIHSTSPYAERYAEKKICLLCKMREKEQLVNEFKEKNKVHQKVTNLASDIHECRERIRLTKYCIKRAQENLIKRKEKLNNMKLENQKYSSRLPSFGKKMSKYENFIKEKKYQLTVNQSKYDKEQTKMKLIARTNLKQLVEFIFPISIIQPSASQEEFESDATASAIAEASRTNYLKGEWIYTDTSSEVQYCIVAPTLPGSRDYSQYNYWVKANRDGAADTYEQAAYSIGGALTYTTQLVSIIAFFLDVRLPHKLNYSEFCGNELSERKFSKRVTWLNTNILHLFFSQTIPLDLDIPMHPLHYILVLLKSDLPSKQSNHKEIHSQLMETILDQMCLPNSISSASYDSDSEDEDENSDNVPYEWENVPLITGGPGDYDLSPESQQTQSSHLLGGTQAQASSVAEGLVTSAAASIASLWPWRRRFSSNR